MKRMAPLSSLYWHPVLQGVRHPQLQNALLLHDSRLLLRRFLKFMDLQRNYARNI